MFEKQKPSVAFSLDEGSIKWVAVERTNAGIQVTEYGFEFLGPDILTNDDVIVHDAMFVKRLRGIIGRTKFEVANMVIPDHQALCFHTHITKESTKQMGDVIMDHIKAYCQTYDLLGIVEYVCEYDVINETQFGYDVHVTLVPKSYSNHLVRLFKQAGVEIKYIETAHHAVAKSCMNIPTGSGYVSVAFGNTRTHVSVIHGEHLVSHDIVPVGTSDLTRTIEKFLRISKSEAEKIIARHGVLQTHPDNGLLSELFLTLAPVYRSIDNQLVTLGEKSYKTFGDRFKIDTMVVYGNGVGIKGLVGFLGEQTNLRVAELDVWAGSPDRAPILNLPVSETLIYAEPLALALGYLK